MSLLNRCCRAWTSLLLLQDVGFIWMCHCGKAEFLSRIDSAEVSRQHSLAVALVAVVRLLLLKFFESRLLQATHLSVTTVYSLGMLGEMFYYKSVNSSIVNIARILVQVITAVVFTAAHHWLMYSVADPQQRKRVFYAKHYMEEDVLRSLDSNTNQYAKKQA